jgi:hypothetical protein
MKIGKLSEKKETIKEVYKINQSSSFDRLNIQSRHSMLNPYLIS